MRLLPRPEMGCPSERACRGETKVKRFTVLSPKVTVNDCRKCPLPAGSTHVPDLHVEKGQEGVPTEGAGGVQVGVVGCPTGHDFLIIHKAVTRLTARTAGNQKLEKDRTGSAESAQRQSYPCFSFRAAVLPPWHSC